MASKSIRLSAVAIVLGIAAYWYWSPIVAIWQMQSAAQAGDADSFNDHVDYPRLRESFKGQFSALLTKRMGSQPDTSGTDLAKAGTALGTMLGLAMVDRVVDTMVRPEVVMQAMKDGKLGPQQRAADNVSPNVQTAPAKKTTWTTERKGVDKYIAYGGEADSAVAERIGLVLERSGFATWRLTEVRLPSFP